MFQDVRMVSDQKSDGMGRSRSMTIHVNPHQTRHITTPKLIQVEVAPEGLDPELLPLLWMFFGCQWRFPNHGYKLQPNQASQTIRFSIETTPMAVRAEAAGLHPDFLTTEEKTIFGTEKQSFRDLGITKSTLCEAWRLR